MISVLLPSRGRPEVLTASIWTLRSLAAKPDDVEILVALDPDDAENYLPPLPGVTYWIAPERWGYAGLHHYYNALAFRAKAYWAAQGGWLLLWNDDAQMLTQGWDQIIESQPQEFLWLGANHSAHASMFPAWPAAWTRQLGHVSLSPHCDTWLQWLAGQIGRLRQIPVKVDHDRADITGGNDDATYREGRGKLPRDGYVDGIEPDRNVIAGDALMLSTWLAAQQP